MLRGFRTALVCLGLLGGWTAPMSAQITTSAQFDVQAFGLTIGVFRITGSTSKDRYTASASFSTTGVAGQLKPVQFSLKSSGHRSGPRFHPRHYDEEVDTGQRHSSVQMRYAGGVPTLTGGRLDTGSAPKLNPAGERGSVDPLTALFIVARDQPESEVCKVDQRMFDGARRTRITLSRTGTKNGRVTCQGWFLRLAGYSPEQMAKQRKFRISVTYSAAPGGVMQAQSAQLQTMHGKVALSRR